MNFLSNLVKQTSSALPIALTNQTLYQFSNKISFYFLDKKSDKKIKVEANIGDNLLEIAHGNQVPLEGACEGSLACSTCHVILSQDLYKKIPEPSDREFDTLDLVPKLTDTSRLACAIKVSKEFQNQIITVPNKQKNIHFKRKK